MARRSLRLIASTLAIGILCLPAVAKSQISSDCASPPPKGPQWSWSRGAVVTVFVSDDFSSFTGARQAIEGAFRLWTAENPLGVKFDLIYREPALTAANTMTVRSVSLKGTGQAQTVLGSYAGALIFARCEIDKRVTDPTAIANAMAHEIGHTFGLAECDDCEDGSSVMTRYSGIYNDTTTGRNGPSACDVSAVQLSTKTLRP